MKQRFWVLTFLASLAMTSLAHATVYEFSGNIRYISDIVTFGFALDNPGTNVRIWTDSFQNGKNFDSTIDLWTASGAHLANSEDDPAINPATQTYWDSGLDFPELAAGRYLLTLVAHNNARWRDSLADGFAMDGLTPTPIGKWQYDVNTHIERTGFYHIVFDGVDSASPVPEPSTFILLGAGLAGVAFMRRRQKA